jgi:hypothetical protein
MTAGPQDSPTWPPETPAPQDRTAPAAPGSPAGQPSATPAAARRRPRHPRRIAAVAAAVLLVAGAGTALGVGGHRVEQHQTFTQDITALTVDAGGADVTVRGGGPPGRVEVTRKIRWAWGDLPASPDNGKGWESWTGTTLDVRLACPSVCDVDYEVTVPGTVAVTATAGSGDLRLSGTLGAVAVDAVSGDVDADVTTNRLTARSGSGDIELRLRSAPAELHATTGSGDVDIRLPRGQAYAVDARTDSGETEIEVPRGTASDPRVQVQTGSGDIRLQSR